MRILLVCWLGGLAGCGYSDFELPKLAGGTGPAYRFEAAPEPVLSRGAPGDWDSRDALNPSVVLHGGLYYNLYSGFDGKTWRTGLATSPDGVRWAKAGPVLTPDAAWEGAYIAANGSALMHEGRFWYWYQSGPKETPRIGLARSQDGGAWTKNAHPVLDVGPRGSWDERAVADPYVIRIDRWFYLFYLGQDRARRQQLGVARSLDGEHWEKLRSNPILEIGDEGAFDENGLGEPAVWVSAGYYWMLYTGRDRNENRRMGLARSRDGVHWERRAHVIAGTAAWNAKVVCDPTVEVRPDGVRVWFGGGDRPSPDENLNGQIGIGRLY